jgi:hypothetical protein
VGLTGGCLCGAVRYELLSEPFDAGYCHCRTCQLNSGSPAMVFATVPHGDLVWTQGSDKVKSVNSSGFGHRWFCGECGTPFLMQVDHQSETTDFSVATLDDPDSVAPGYHIFWGSRIGWFEPGDVLPRHNQFRPDTRGLEGDGAARIGQRLGCGGAGSLRVATPSSMSRRHPASFGAVARMFFQMAMAPARSPERASASP